MSARNEVLRQLWDMLDDGDVSTETLFALVVSAARARGYEVDEGDVSDALAEAQS